MSPKAKKSTARNHSEARGCLCAVCFEKTADVRVISSDAEKLIQTFSNPMFSLNNQSLPSSICSKCRLNIDRLSKVTVIKFLFKTQ